MPKYFLNKIAGYYLYYTKHCVIECMHAHASDKISMIEKFSKFKSLLNYTIWKYMKCGQKTVEMDFLAKKSNHNKQKLQKPAKL